MKTATLITAAVLVGSLVLLSLHGRHGAAPAGGDATWEPITAGPIAVYTDCEGVIEARRTWPVASPLSQPAVLIELAPEGATVARGDVLSRFDPAGLERDVIRLGRDALLARAKRDELRDATQPQELDDLELKLSDAEAQLAAARELLADTQALRDEDLVSAQEVAQQEREVARLTRLQAACSRQLERTRAVIHPAALQRAEAELDSADRELDLMRQQLAGCVVTASEPGLVVYNPLHLGGDYRTARVGDTVYRNQPFMTVADMSDLVVGCFLPESDLALVRADQPAEITPVAYPELRLPARVESLGSMAYAIAGRPVWQKFVRVSLRLTGVSPELRSGMTVRVRVLSYSRAQAVLIPRRAVQWTGDNPSCQVDQRGRPHPTPLKLGFGNDTHYEVLAGVQPGARVLAP
ncbi:MAG: HlyD family efflux transporter periplasmic adaptor subunit [Lentisphaerae bacterium]|nr:HlyD family efflux transporter periplasmic adaptor subunit [Lentisphaerota bacterium]